MNKLGIRNLKKSQEKLKTHNEKNGIFFPENAINIQWRKTTKWNTFSNPSLIYSSKLTLSAMLMNKHIMCTTLIPEVMYKTHDELWIFLSSVGMNVCSNAYT